MKNTFIILALLFCSTFAWAQTDDGHKHKIVFQFVSGDTLSQKSLISNLTNLKAAWPKSQVEVVFHSNGIFMVMGEKTKYAKELENFATNNNIKMVVCQNTMKQKKISKEELLPFVTTVPMGIGELVLKQEKGWSYLKAGN